MSRSVSASILDNVDTSIGGISHLCVPTFQMVHRPNAMLKFRPDRFNNLREYSTTSFPLCATDHRRNLAFAIIPFCGKKENPIGKHLYDAESATPSSYYVYLESSESVLAFACAEKAAIFEFVFENKKITSKGITIFSRNGMLNASGSKISGFDIIKARRNGKPCRERDTKIYLYGELEGGEFSNGQQCVQTASALIKSGGNFIRFRYAISYISSEFAEKNFADISEKTVASLSIESEKIWEEKLSKIKIKGGTIAQRKLFYTSLWRCFERMSNFSEYGYYKGFDGIVHKETSFDFRNDDWSWDTYRTLHPLMVILDPAAEVENLRSYIRMYEDSGFVPTFPSVCGDRRGMINNHYAPIFWDAYAKGLRGFDLRKAYEGCRKTILERSIVPWYDGAPTKLDEFYNKCGYFPALKSGENENVPQVDTLWEKRQSVSVSLGQSYDDWCVANMAREIGDISGEKLFFKRAKNYKNLFDKNTKFFAPKDAEGNFVKFDPKCLDGGARPYYAENNAWTYRWDVPHDIMELVKMYGGAKEFEKSLDSIFVEPLGAPLFKFFAAMPDSTGMIGQFSAGNEPSFNIPYLYAYVGVPWKTQKAIDFICDRWFRADYMGLPGDEDGGAMSAYYVFNALGFYPITPGLPMYVIGTPMFSESEIFLPNGKVFKIIAHNRTKKNKYIQNAKLNGIALDRAWFSHRELADGGILEFTMGERPNKNWASSPNSIPPSFKMP